LDQQSLIRIERARFSDLTPKKSGGGVNTKILLDSGVKVLLKGVDKADISISDFDFI